MARRVSLPQAPANNARADCGTPRPSRRGRWRALTLILVHVAAAAHIAHWMINGTTVTPVEPSEAMQTLGQEALLNAGFVLFALLIVSTLVFGRFFCGWGCHVVALQDLCTWLLRKIGMQPRPFRSRLLVYVPLLAFTYMFVAPTVVRLWLGQPRAPTTAHFLTDDFWERFPEWPISLLTFAVCGFLIVYLLGNKGFCTYGCPYGGIFGVADKFAPGRILVTDACEGCGHCTATCTSNVRVHEEVRTWGMVVDPGCMKCMDCVSVCPKDALHFGFGRPAVAKHARDTPASRRFDFTWPEEIALATIFIASIVVLRGLYDRIPFLLALGTSAISATVLLAALRMLYVDNLRYARVQLRRGGRITRGGWLFAVGAVLWTAFLVHSGAVKNFAYRGARVTVDANATHADLQRALVLLERSRRWALVPTGRVDAATARAHERLGDADAAIDHYRRAVAREPRYAQGRVRLAALLAERGEREPAADQLREALRIDPDLPGTAGDLSDLLVALGRADEAAEALRTVLERRPDDAGVRASYGVVLAHCGDFEGSERELRRVISSHPNHVDAYLNLGRILANQDRFGDALVLFEEVAALAPKDVQGHYLAGQAAHRLGRQDDRLRHLESARRLAPFSPGVVREWVIAFRDNGASAITATERKAASDATMRFALMHLYRAAGRAADAARLAGEFEGTADPAGR